MRRIVRYIAFVVVALSLACAPRASHAGSGATPTVKNCFFVRNNLPCPCPRAQQARAVVRAVRTTAGALGTAIETTAGALALADRKQGAPADLRNASQSPQSPKR